jgi:threonine/homoserine/homoserine lactone efflux protein
MLESYLLFATIWFVAAATPGADTMLLLTTSLTTGWRSAIPVSLAITSAKVILLTVTFFGLTALIQDMPEVFVALKIFGAGFLLWRAYKMWNATPSSNLNTRVGFWQNFGLAFTVAVSNPQALMFYFAVVPQVSQDTNMWVLNAIIAIGFTLISAFYILLAAPIRAWISRGSNQRLLNRAVAIVFVLLAAAVVLR